MFSATDFTYDGINSETYGVKIATINSSVVEETAYVTPTITTVKPVKGKRFHYVDSKYEEVPTVEFSILSSSPISDEQQRNILRWIDNRKGFKTLIIHQPELEQYVYQCIFNVTSIIYHAGFCIGFNLKATFDSPYHYSEQIETKITGSGTVENIIIDNDCDIIDDYVYPILSFKSTGYLDNNCNIEIYNKTDDSSLIRPFKFCGIPLNAMVSVDNEFRIVSSDDISGDLLGKFENKNWLRLVRGENILQIKIKGELTISFPKYIKIRF